MFRGNSYKDVDWNPLMDQLGLGCDWNSGKNPLSDVPLTPDQILHNVQAARTTDVPAPVIIVVLESA